MPTPFTTLFSEYAAVADRISRRHPPTTSYQAGLCLTDAGRGQVVLHLMAEPERAPVALTPVWETPAEGVAHIRRLHTIFLADAAFPAMVDATQTATVSQARMARPAASHPDADELEHMAYTPFIAWCAARAERRPATITFWGFCSWEAEICAYNGEVALWHRFWFTTRQALTALALSCQTPTAKARGLVPQPESWTP